MTSTAMRPWAEIPEGRERDAAVAEHVFGLRQCNEDYELRDGTPVRCRPWRNSAGEAAFCGDSRPFRYSTDAAADYSVLEFVRREFTQKQIDEFGGCLFAIWDDRYGSQPQRITCGAEGFMYEPGDWSWAAYEAKRLTQEGER